MAPGYVASLGYRKGKALHFFFSQGPMIPNPLFLEKPKPITVKSIY